MLVYIADEHISLVCSSTQYLFILSCKLLSALFGFHVAHRNHVSTMNYVATMNPVAGGHAGRRRIEVAGAQVIRMDSRLSALAAACQSGVLFKD